MHAVCWIFTVQTIDNILNKSGKKGLLSFFLVIYMKAFTFRSAV